MYVNCPFFSAVKCYYSPVLKSVMASNAGDDNTNFPIRRRVMWGNVCRELGNAHNLNTQRHDAEDGIVGAGSSAGVVGNF